MRTSKVPQLAVVPEPQADPVIEQRSRVAKLVDERVVAAERMTAKAVALKEAEVAFDDGKIDVIAKAAATEEHASAERMYRRCEDAEAAERVTLARLEAVEMKRTYERAVLRAQDWLVKLKPTIDALVALDEQHAKLIDDALDVVVAAQADYDDAEKVERDARPMFSMAANGIRRVELKDVRYLVRVAIALARKAAGREVPGQWLDAEQEPKVGAHGSAEFRKAEALLLQGGKK